MLRRSAILFGVATLLLAGAAVHGRAALESTLPAANDTGLRLMVIEVQGCFTCDLVHRHIAPAYARTPQAREAPLGYVDLNTVEEDALGLSSPVTIVPTIVLMQDGREVSRLAGYMGPDIFLQAVEHMLAQVR